MIDKILYEDNGDENRRLKFSQESVTKFNILIKKNDPSVEDLVTLGIMYENGFGVDKNIFNAIECYYKAALLGDKSAIDSIFRLSDGGNIVSADILKQTRAANKALGKAKKSSFQKTKRAIKVRANDKRNKAKRMAKNRAHIK